MKVSELFVEGLFGSKPKGLVRTDITADDRKMITSVFSSGHNADLRMARGDYVLPQNVTVNHKRARINFYKDGDKLKASVGHYRDENGPGDPKVSPVTHTDHDINDVEDLKKLHKSLNEGRVFRNGAVLEPQKKAGPVEPLKTFKKGQIVTVKKTGEKVEVMSMRDGLVFTASKDAVKVPDDKRVKLMPGKGYKEYMPRELE